MKKNFATNYYTVLIYHLYEEGILTKKESEKINDNYLSNRKIDYSFLPMNKEHIIYESLKQNRINLNKRLSWS
ncbi:hypothetical protein [Cellulophaga lytica]|uniref:hypothetical protein n=1 Tax=Cellulophaga lytica TaxID=979 RepID=UPI000B5C6FC3|nr:hypothetical protein [Cellulophaga lytica]